MGLKVTVLGCSGSYPGPGGACSGYLVEDDSTKLWLDAGSGTLANLQRHIDPADLDAVVLSHEHPDHWTDLEGFQHVLRFVLEREGFPVYAPAGLRDRTYDGMDPWVAWHEIADGDRVTVKTLGLTFSRTDHGPETLAVRVDAPVVGKSFGYSADTGPEWSVEALGTELDGVLCEATLTRDLEGKLKHLSAYQAGTFAREAKARRLVLTHLWATDDPVVSQQEGSEAFGAAAELAEAGKVFEW